MKYVNSRNRLIYLIQLSEIDAFKSFVELYTFYEIMKILLKVFICFALSSMLHLTICIYMYDVENEMLMNVNIVNFVIMNAT